MYNLPYNEIITKNTSLVSSILLQQKLSKKLTTNISYYMGYRNPNIDDIGKIFSKNDVNVVVPNENLKPERTNNFEYNLNYNSSVIKFELQIFKTKILDAIERSNSSLFGQDSIYYDGDLMQVQMNQNIESAEINGLSFGSEINITKKINFDFKISYIKGETGTGRPLAHIPPLNSQLNLNYSLKKHLFNISHVYNGWKNVEEYDDNGVDNFDEATEQGTPAWQIINLKYNNNFSSNITFSISTQNLFDVHYKTFGSGISSSGRNFIVSLTNRF
jgi:hemoglobin/transferrin/lactoferrin receptor protein